MHVLLVEDLTSGALPLDGPDWFDLASEGAAMLRALAEDACEIPDWRIEVLWSRKLGDFPIPGVTVHFTDSPEEEQRLFSAIARRVDRSFVIAPEFDRRLERRREMVEAADGHFAGSQPEALALCGDKLLLAEHLQRQGLPTVPTRLFDLQQANEELRHASPNGLVIKPRDGAGSMNTFPIRDAGAMQKVAAYFDRVGAVPIMQPFIPCQAISIAAIVSSSEIELFPPASQEIESGEQLTYLGGSVGSIPRDRATESIVRATLESIPGLFGYIGVDLIAADSHEKTPPLILEINPRLTTSYLGYRQLARTNLVPRMLNPDGDYQDIQWRDQSIGFTPK